MPTGCGAGRYMGCGAGRYVWTGNRTERYIRWRHVVLNSCPSKLEPHVAVIAVQRGCTGRYGAVRGIRGGAGWYGALRGTGGSGRGE